eukprot:scaffold309959_cov39-Tisochrysis_lutea.AAC.2
MRRLALLAPRCVALATAGSVLSGCTRAACEAAGQPVGAMLVHAPQMQQVGEPSGSRGNRTQKEAVTGHLKIGVTMREVQEGEGEVAMPGMVAVVHYIVTLVGDGTVLDNTRTSGHGDRRCEAPAQQLTGGASALSSCSVFSPYT